MTEYGFAEGMAIGMAKRAAGEVERGTMVFDWDRAAELIRECKPEVAEAGLAGDWDCTGGEIYANGKPTPREDTYVFLASFWATPQIELDGERIDCFRMRAGDDDWDSGAYWPASALAILSA